MKKDTGKNIRKAFYTALLTIAAALLTPGAAFGQTPQALFQAANQDYQNGNYAQAAVKYDSLVRIGYRSAALYNNLGNANYRLGRVAPTILAYERASLLAPADDEIRHNLSLARTLTADNIVPLGESLSERVTDALTQTLSTATWSILSVVFAWGALALFLLFLYSLRTGTKRWSFYGFLLSLVLCATSYGLRRHGENEVRNNPYSIVTVANVTAKSEPSIAGGDVFSIHEGTKVRVMESLNKWNKIRLADGKIGWIPAGAAEKI